MLLICIPVKCEGRIQQGSVLLKHLNRIAANVNSDIDQRNIADVDQATGLSTQRSMSRNDATGSVSGAAHCVHHDPGCGGLVVIGVEDRKCGEPRRPEMLNLQTSYLKSTISCNCRQESNSDRWDRLDGGDSGMKLLDLLP